MKGEKATEGEVLLGKDDSIEYPGLEEVPVSEGNLMYQFSNRDALLVGPLLQLG